MYHFLYLSFQHFSVTIFVTTIVTTFFYFGNTLAVPWQDFWNIMAGPWLYSDKNLIILWKCFYTSFIWLWNFFVQQENIFVPLLWSILTLQTLCYSCMSQHGLFWLFGWNDRVIHIFHNIITDIFWNGMSWLAVVKPNLILWCHSPTLFLTGVSKLNKNPESLRNIWQWFHGEPALKKGYTNYIWTSI